MIQSSLRWEGNTERSTVVILSPLLVKQPVSGGQRSSQQAGQLHPLLLLSVRPRSCPLSILLSWQEAARDSRSNKESSEFPSEGTGQEGSPVRRYGMRAVRVFTCVVGCQLVLVHVAIFDSVSAVHLCSAHSVTWHWLRATLEICCLSAIAPLPFPLTPPSPPHPHTRLHKCPPPAPLQLPWSGRENHSPPFPRLSSSTSRTHRSLFSSRSEEERGR